MKKRRNALLAHARDAGAGALVSYEPENLFYMTGFWGEATGVLRPDGAVTIVAPALEAERAERDSVDCDVVSTERGAPAARTLSALVAGEKACTDCRDPAAFRELKKACPAARQDDTPFTESRMTKDVHEVRAIQHASSVIDEMFELCTSTMHVGMRESELQAKLMAYAAERELFDTGYRYTTNPLIVASGPNSALPHAQVTQRKFERGDLVTVDITLRYHGYVSDATRTFSMGTVGHKQREVYNIVKEAQERGLAALAVNAPCKSIDSACRDHIFAEGYGSKFVHATGHGIGLDVHEEPTLSARSTRDLARGMTVTVEPGIYIPRTFGVRIEDSAIVRKRPASLHEFTRELLII